MNYSDLLIEFHRQLLRWLDDGCPEHPVFDPNMGLCRNLKDWAKVNGYSVGSLSFALYAAFRAKDLDDTYPFYLPPKTDAISGYTTGEYESARYQYREERSAIYKNVRRLYWIRNFAARTKSDENPEFQAHD